MKNITTILALSILFLVKSSAPLIYDTKSLPTNADAEWAIIGAGPAGIITIGLLLDLGTDPQSIIWVDPEFSVGRLGKYYSSIPGNAKTKQFIEFLHSCHTFSQIDSPAIAKLRELDQEFEYPLKVIVDPLRDISSYLCQRVTCDHAALCSLTFENNLWRVGTSDLCFTANHVVLATGCHPKRLDYNCKNEIPLDLALDKEALAQYVCLQDTIAVVGSGQSAILLLKHLSELPTGRVINFYRNPINFDHPETGLKGMTARWARDVLLKAPPINLIRIYNTSDSLKAWLPICTKIIYAVGFERNELPPITNAPYINFEDRNGIIGPRLFGIGIAFPEKYDEPSGQTVSKIGLMSFMEYAQAVLPQWVASKSRIIHASQFEDLFSIMLL